MVPPKKAKPAVVETNYSSKVQKMMQKMGYQPDKGLGKASQGILQPIEASKQKGRRGLGVQLTNVDKSAEEFNETQEIVRIPEYFAWIQNKSTDLAEYTRDLLEDWMVHGAPKLTMDDEDNFIDSQLLADVLRAKSTFDELGENDMLQARTRSNPFEKIKGAIFLNRAAIKMANMDALLGYMFTQPVDQQGSPLVRPDGLLYFADVCAGPGGFSEYVLFRKKWLAKGFGFTLKERNDFDLEKFLAGHPETFHTYYGPDGDGNVYSSRNIDALTQYIMDETETGVHFMMADGGFSVKGQENSQEILSKQLYLCQCLVGLNVVREHGHLVIKMFDLLTPFSAGLIYLMYKCFHEICILKPNSSRPANSERYLVCKWKRANTDAIQKHLAAVNEHLNARTSPPAPGAPRWEDVLELVPYEVLKQDREFFKYLNDSNNRIARNQITGLRKIAAYCQDALLQEDKQEEVREQCLRAWNIPNDIRKVPPVINRDAYFKHLLRDWHGDREFVNAKPTELTKENLARTFGDFQEHWYFIPLEFAHDNPNNVRTFFMSRGKRDVTMWQNGQWVELRNVIVEMAPHTLIYGEVVKELRGEHMRQNISYALHIIDGLVLGDQDIRHLPLQERLSRCRLFAEAHHKSPRYNTLQVAPLRCKQLHPFKDLSMFFNNMDNVHLKNSQVRKGYRIRNSEGKFFVPRALLFVYDLVKHVTLHFSKTKQTHYYSDAIQKHSFFLQDLEKPNAIKASFRAVFTNRFLWKWEALDQVAEPHFDAEGKDLNHRNDEKMVYRADLELICRKNKYF